MKNCCDTIGDQRATVVVLVAEIKDITTTRGDCRLFFELDGLQKETLYGCAPVSTDSVIRGLLWPPKKWKIKEMCGSQVSKHVPSENRP
jgi:hypothetical protein